MIERQRKTKAPCPGCGLHLQRCICELMMALPTRTRVCLVVHAKELKRTTNTGRLVVKALSNSQMLVRGLGDLDLSTLLTPNYTSLLLYPSENAIELTDEFVRTLQPPIQLIVPDGNWRQASKVHTRHQELQDIPRVKLPLPAQREMHLRNESHPYGMATLEAIASALSIVENPKTGDYLQTIYQAKLKQTLAGRQGEWL